MGINRAYKIACTSLFMWGYSSGLQPFFDKTAQNFVKKYSVAPSVQSKADALFSRPGVTRALLHRNRKKLQELGFKLYSTWKPGGAVVAEHPDLDGWIVKGDKWSIYGGRNIARLAFGDHIKKTIEKLKLDDFEVVDEYLYHLPGKKRSLNGNNYVVLSKKITPLPGGVSAFSDEFLQRIKSFIRKIGYWDAHSDNVLPVQRGDKIKAVFIDTEPLPSFDTWLWGAVRLLAGSLGARRFRRVISKRARSAT